MNCECGTWWNGAHKGKSEYSEQNLPQCHSVHHKFRLDFLGIEPGSPQCKATDL